MPLLQEQVQALIDLRVWHAFQADYYRGRAGCTDLERRHREAASLLFVIVGDANKP